MESVLVIGGSGFVGQATVRAFKRRGCDLTVLNRGNLPLQGVRQLTADRNAPEALRAALGEQRFDLVVDTVCYTPLQASILLAAIKGKCGSVITVSSGTVYRDRPDKPPAETERSGGAAIWGEYARNKSLAEEAYASAQGYFDQVIAVRPPYLFGPGNNLDRETWFWARQLNRVPVVLPGDGKASAQFVHEDDFGDALHFLATRDSKGFQIFNIADSQELTFIELVALLAAVVERSPEYICLFDTHKDVRVRSWFPFQDYPCLTGPDKLYQLGWRPAKTLKTWFEETYRDLLRQGHRFTPVLSDLEQRVMSERIRKCADASEPFAGQQGR